MNTPNVSPGSASSPKSGHNNSAAGSADELISQMGDMFSAILALLSDASRSLEDSGGNGQGSQQASAAIGKTNNDGNSQSKIFQQLMTSLADRKGNPNNEETDVDADADSESQSSDIAKPATSDVPWSHRLHTELPPGLKELIDKAGEQAPSPKPWEPLIVASKTPDTPTPLPVDPPGSNLASTAETPTAVNPKTQLMPAGASTPTDQDVDSDGDNEIEVDDSTGQIQALNVQTPATNGANETQKVHTTHITHRVNHAVPIDQLVSVVAPMVSGTDGTHNISLKLTPAELGTIHLRIEVHKGEIDIHIHAESPETESALREHLPELQTEFEQLGMHTGAFDVKSGDPQTQQNATQNHSASIDIAEAEDKVIQELRDLAQQLSSTSDLDLRL